MPGMATRSLLLAQCLGQGGWKMNPEREGWASSRRHNFPNKMSLWLEVHSIVYEEEVYEPFMGGDGNVN